ncbi:MAG: hypothetical protein ABJH63_03490 [Rhizobiaceae bacterium]
MKAATKATTTTAAKMMAETIERLFLVEPLNPTATPALVLERLLAQRRFVFSCRENGTASLKIWLLRGEFRAQQRILTPCPTINQYG